MKKTKKIKHSPVQKVLIQIEQKPVTIREQDLLPEKDGGKYMIPKTWLSEKQVIRMVQKTPPQHVYKRPAKGGGEWSYVTGNYVEKVLNFTFGWNWDFEIVETKEKYGQVISLGKLTVKNDKGQGITKMQAGRADIKFRKGTKEPLDYGNDEKAANTDALKKCASLLGIASDIYGKMEYKAEVGTEVAQTPVNAPKAILAPQIIPAMAVSMPDCLGLLGKGCPFGSSITRQEEEYSLKIYKKALCRQCQDEAKPWKK